MADGAPVFDIRLGGSSADARVSVNGQDISAALHGVQVECHAGELTRITLFVQGRHRVRVDGAIEHVALKEPVTVSGSITEGEWADIGRPHDCEAM